MAHRRLFQPVEFATDCQRVGTAHIDLSGFDKPRCAGAYGASHTLRQQTADFVSPSRRARYGVPVRALNLPLPSVSAWPVNGLDNQGALVVRCEKRATVSPAETTFPSHR
jgi:hypothetical protein